jgi:hypothetical protein
MVAQGRSRTTRGAEYSLRGFCTNMALEGVVSGVFHDAGSVAYQSSRSGCCSLYVRHPHNLQIALCNSEDQMKVAERVDLAKITGSLRSSHSSSGGGHSHASGSDLTKSKLVHVVPGYFPATIPSERTQSAFRRNVRSTPSGAIVLTRYQVILSRGVLPIDGTP